MATINLTISLNQTGATSHRIRYARIDNVLNPVFVTVSPDVANSPNLVYTIAENVPNGQYRIGYKSLYSDLRTCEEQFIDTPACSSLISINAYLDGNNIIVQYLAPSDAPKVRITVNYPNGGSYTANYVNNGNDIPIALPTNVYGDFTVTGQSVCDEESGFYSPPSSQVVVTREQTNLTITNTSPNLSIITLVGINGFELSQIIAPGNSLTGTHTAFYGSIELGYSNSPTVDCSAQLLLNGTIIQCIDIAAFSPAADIVFSPAAFSDTDQCTINLVTGSCP
jgi:hypothetical protein